MIRSAADDNIAVASYTKHLIVLAIEREELAGAMLLEYVTVQLSAQIQSFTVLILCNIASALQIAYKQCYEQRVAYRVCIYHCAKCAIIATLANDYF